MPACPGFYHQPATISELARQFAGRILDQLGLEHQMGPRWGEQD
jgi:4-hydroxy-3-polyprenylbenzoate decarboxylase